MWASTAQPTLLSELCLALLSGMSTTLMGHRPGWHGLIYRITTIQYREKYRTVLIVEGDKYDFLSFIKGSPPPPSSFYGQSRHHRLPPRQLTPLNQHHRPPPSPGDATVPPPLHRVTLSTATLHHHGRHAPPPPRH
jgi:hypothetical protein